MSDSVQLITDRLLLRSWRESDRHPFAEMNADPATMEFMPAPLSSEQSDQAFERITNHWRKHGFGLWAVEHRAAGEFIGFIGVSIPDFAAPFMPAVEIGWRLASNWWGQGLATEGAQAAAPYAFESLQLEELVSFTVPANIRSRRVMQKLGMTHHPLDDFDHPNLPPGHPLRRHVLYRLRRQDWLKTRREQSRETPH